MVLVASIKIVFTGRTAQAPEVLVLTPRAITPTESLEGDEVLALLQVRGNVEFGCHFAILGIAGKLSVDIKIDIGSHATEVGDDTLTIPVGRDVDDAAIRTHMIILDWNSRRLLIEMTTPSEAHVYILRIAVAQHFPVAWHLDVVPLRVIEVCLVEVGRTLIGVSYPLELPCTVERQIVHALLLVKILSTSTSEVIWVVSEVHGVQRQTIDFIHLKVVPFCESRLLAGYRFI